MKKIVRFKKRLDDEKLTYLYRSGAYEINIKDAQSGVSLVQKHQDIFTDFEILKGQHGSCFFKCDRQEN